uniref:DH domain-containing protein n=1 Tax=Hucho hucho TaxID=62062 RepID=A0A4W5L900_9TELE
MEGRNDVDLSNSNITPLWKRRSANHTGPSKPKARPLSYQIDGVHMTDFPVEDNKCSFTLSQPAERLVATPGGGTVILNPFTLTAHRDQIVFGTSPSPPDPASSKHPSPPATPNNNHHHNQTSPSSYHPLTPVPSPPNPSPSTPSLHTPTPTPFHSSTSSIHSLSSLISNPSDSPTPRSPSSADMSAPSPSPSPSPTPTLSPSISLSPPPSIVLSTHSAAALKMGTQQLIPKGLASLSKASPAGVQSQGLGPLLGLDPTKRALRALSMVETGSFFSTGVGSGGGGADQDESPGSLKRGLRSTSYRRAVVSGVEMETHRLSQPVLKGLQEVKERPTSPGKKNKVGRDLFKEELYQNYQEKALHNDSDEDQSREPKPDDRIVVQYRPIRTSWSQLSVVRHTHSESWCSAIFELISSEHSYLHSLEVLIRMFQNSAELSDTMTKTEHHHLFSNITDVCEASVSKLLTDTVCIYLYIQTGSHTHICGHTLSDRHICCSGVGKCCWHMWPFPLVSSSRWMVKRGELTAFVEENGIFSKRTSRQQVYFFLFNDVLILTRKKRWVHSRTSQSQPIPRSPRPITVNSSLNSQSQLTPTVSLANHSELHIFTSQSQQIPQIGRVVVVVMMKKSLGMLDMTMASSDSL